MTRNRTHATRLTSACACQSGNETSPKVTGMSEDISQYNDWCGLSAALGLPEVGTMMSLFPEMKVLTLLLLWATYLDHVIIMWPVTTATGVEVPGCQKLVGDVRCLQRAIHSVPGQVYLERPAVAGLSEKYVPYMSKFSRWISPLSTDGHYSGHLTRLVFFCAELANLTLAHWLP